MTDQQAQEANEIISALEARVHLLEGMLEDGAGPSPGVGNDAFCVGCYRWRLGVALAVGMVSGLIAQAASEQHMADLGAIFGNANVGEFIVVAATALSPVGAVAVEWQTRLYKGGCPGLFRAVANMVAEFKKGLKE